MAMTVQGIRGDATLRDDGSVEVAVLSTFRKRRQVLRTLPPGAVVGVTLVARSTGDSIDITTASGSGGAVDGVRHDDVVAFATALGVILEEPEPEATTPGGEIDVADYDSQKDFMRDAQVRASNGWRVAAQSQGESKVRKGRTAGKVLLTGGAGLLLSGRSRKPGALTVTWVR